MCRSENAAKIQLEIQNSAMMFYKMLEMKKPSQKSAQFLRMFRDCYEMFKS